MVSGEQVVVVVCCESHVNVFGRIEAVRSWVGSTTASKDFVVGFEPIERCDSTK